MDPIVEQYLKEILRVIQGGPLRGMGKDEVRNIKAEHSDGLWRLEGLAKEALAYGARNDEDDA